MFQQDILKWVGLVAAVCTALTGQSDLLGEPWKHYVTITGIAASAAFAYFITPKGSIKE
jgi:hypothetical protein